MISLPVSYEGAIKRKIDEFNSIPNVEKNGNYWDNTDDGDLSDVKKHIKDHYISIQDHICPYCQQQIIVDHNSIWDAEHIIPKAQKPEFMFTPENLCVSCKDCNGEKSNKNILTKPKNKRFSRKSESYTICHPHFDKYNEHLIIIKSPLFFIPKTDKGRKTIEVCGLLRFLFILSDFDNASSDVITKIVELSQQLQKTSDDPAEQTFLLAYISDLCQQGIRVARENRLRKAVKIAA